MMVRGAVRAGKSLQVPRGDAETGMGAEVAQGTAGADGRGRRQGRGEGDRGADARVWRRWLARCGGPSGVAAALSSALLLVAAYPGVALGPLALVAWGPLLWRLRRGDVDPVGAAWLGGLMGTVLHVAVFHWIAHTMEVMSGLPPWLAALALLAYGVGMAPHQAIVAALLAWWTRRRPQSRAWPWLVAWAVLATEVVVPYQFPWYLGSALYATPTLHQAADLIGIVGVSALCAATAGLGVQAVVEPGHRRGAILQLVLLLGAWLGYGALRIEEIASAPPARTVRGLLVQHNPSLDEKRSQRPQPRLPMLHRAAALTRKADRSGIDVIVWSEGALPFFYVPTEVTADGDLQLPGKANTLLRRVTRDVDAMSRELNLPWIFGTLRRLDPEWTELARNSAVIWVPGEERRFYDKRLLVPFGERMPGRELFPALAEAIPGVSNLGAGDGMTVVPIRGVTYGLSICYENLFADYVYGAHLDADVLINLTDDVWFGESNATELHLMVQTARAVELRRPLWRATATGVTSSVDAAGRVIDRAPLFVPTTLRVSADIRPIDAPFRWWGPWPARALAAALCALVLLLWWRDRGRRVDAA